MFVRYFVEGRPVPAINDSSDIFELPIQEDLADMLRKAGITTFGELKKYSYLELCNIITLSSYMTELCCVLRLYGVNLEPPERVSKEEKVIKLTVPKNRLKDGTMTVMFNYNEKTGQCEVLEVR